jgi:serine phosphatase RsbU (regulator of sigma subunit)/pSer/pThr/pTyr-binding forkhead associated (FHA) protein
MPQVERKLSAEVTVYSPLVSPVHYSFANEILIIGRSSECNIPVKDRYLSRRHAEIIPDTGKWILKDLGSANGTYLNGARVDSDRPLRSGDRIRVGDTEIVFHFEPATDRHMAIAESKVRPTISIPVHTIERTPELTGKTVERARILNALAIELIEDQPFDQLFGFILDRVMDHLRPSRAAIGLLAENTFSLVGVEQRRVDPKDQSELTISRTLLSEIVERKSALAYTDITLDEKLSRAHSIVMQGIHSVLCAPLLIGEQVVGVLYVDFLFNQRQISEEDVKLVAQIARFAAIKLETTRLREDAIKRHLLDEELKTAYVVQRQLLPEAPPTVPGYTFAGINRPCRTVSGDYFDYVVRPDGTIYFVIADVSGKGVTAALLMAGLQSAFRIFAKHDPTPRELVEQLNQSLKENLPRSKFITMFAGRLQPSTGIVEFTNAGHNPPLVCRRDEVTELSNTDLLLGMFTKAEYQNQTFTLAPGDALALFTDGLCEAENEEHEEFGTERLASTLRTLHGQSASVIARSLEERVLRFSGGEAMADDVTLLVVAREA